MSPSSTGPIVPLTAVSSQLWTFICPHVPLISRIILNVSYQMEDTGQSDHQLSALHDKHQLARSRTGCASLKSSGTSVPRKANDISHKIDPISGEQSEYVHAVRGKGPEPSVPFVTFDETHVVIIANWLRKVRF